MPTLYKFQQAAVWLDGTSLIGHVNEFELPELTWESADHETLGLLGTSQFPTRVEAMEATLTWADYSPDLAAAAANPYQGVNLQVRGAFGVYNGPNKIRDALGRVTMQGRFMGNSLGSFSPGEFERESTLMIDYVKEEFDGTTYLEFSVNPPILRYGGGQNLFAAIRNILGV
ncbi:MAG: phage major tail tube protein [Leptolyngbyaceae cyanobacterium]|mgnify:CR=1 FL=1